MDEIKVWLGGMLTVLAFFVYMAIFSSYSTHTYTGNEIGPVTVRSTQTVSVVSDNAYNLKLESCSPFTVTVDNEIKVDGHPENIKGSSCTTSYYKYEEQVSFTSFEVTNGMVSLYASSETPTGISVAYPEETREDVTSTAGAAIFWIWFILMLMLVMA